MAQKRELSKNDEKSPKNAKKMGLKRLEKLAKKLVEETDFERQKEIERMMMENYYGEDNFEQEIK